ncbi:hypothetical protein IFM89_032036 [Coptis chinensis]|uniref:Transmembrane protein n=1 Tax=Coptis chinensis TaxID=261450 RepID=A0A835LCD1_9MAGN|nr:hypothetical protein IFM89_032036 [Coptis chinensis]
MTTTLPISANISAFNKLYHVLSKRRTSFTLKCLRPITCYAFSRKKIDSFHENKFKMKDVNELCCYFGVRREKDGILSRKNERRRVVVVRVNQFGGGGGRDDGNNARILGNLALAIGLTYLSMTGQLGWVLDAIVSVWILAIILPIAGLGAFLWWAGRNIVQSSCPNCGNEFQIFRSSLKDGLQLCPYCTQPFGGKILIFYSFPLVYIHQLSRLVSLVNLLVYKLKKKNYQMHPSNVAFSIQGESLVPHPFLLMMWSEAKVL